MKISVIQSGGWGGLRMGCSVETADLPVGLSAELEEAASDAALFGHVAAPSAPGRDVAFYEVEIETATGRRSVRFPEFGKPPPGEKIVDILRPMFRPLPRGA